LQKQENNEARDYFPREIVFLLSFLEDIIITYSKSAEMRSILSRLWRVPELEWLEYLHVQGVNVVRPLRLSDGEYISI
jgi:hypothetical protein